MMSDFIFCPPLSIANTKICADFLLFFFYNNLYIKICSNKYNFFFHIYISYVQQIITTKYIWCSCQLDWSCAMNNIFLSSWCQEFTCIHACLLRVFINFFNTCKCLFTKESIAMHTGLISSHRSLNFEYYYYRS